MRIVTACNKKYYPRMAGWLDSLEEHCNVPYTLLKVGWSTPSGRKITETTISREQNEGAPEETESVQHGSFLHVVDGPDEELIMYCDGDMVMQRPFSLQELEWMNNFGMLTASAGWNKMGEMLTEEAHIIEPRVSMAEVRKRFPGDLDGWEMLNVGVLVMRRSAWRVVYNAYMDRWQQAKATFINKAWQQWLICYVMYAQGLDVQRMPFKIHTHGHYGLNPGVNVIDGKTYTGGHLAAISHHIVI